MRRIIVSEFLTLDGVMEAPGGEPGHAHSGWVVPFVDGEFLAYKLAEVLEAESLLIGRVTYESLAGAWPQRTGEFADKMNGMGKHVVSTTLREPTWPGFPEDTTRIDLELGDTRRFGSGVVVAHYRPRSA